MSRGLLIGDVHAKVEDLDDCEKLAGVVLSAIEKEKPDFVVFLGDLYDAFAVKNVLVERWWMGFLNRIPLKPLDIYLLVGNHDRPGDSSQVAHSLQAHIPQAVVVEEPTVLPGNILAMPFYFKAEDFVAAANGEGSRGAATLLCHQSFLGGKYESNQPIEARHDASAVDAAVLPQKCVISGHIHSPQNFGKVWYPGAPRWRNNVSDSLPKGNERHVVAVDFEDGLPKAIRKYETGDVCRRIWKLDDIEGQPEGPLRGKEGDRFVVDITGTAAYIESRKKYWAGPSRRLRTFQTDRPGPKLSEAEGVPAAWGKWAGEYQPKFGTPAETLTTMARERLSL